MFKKEFIYLSIIVVFAFLLRFIWISNVPPAITGDELTYILNIKSFALAGSGIADNWNLLSSLIFRYPTGLPQAELPFFLLYPAVGFLNFSLLTTRLTYVFLSTLAVFAIYLLTKEIFDKRTGIVAALLCAINPWMVFMGRTTYEVVPATLFYMLGAYFLIKEKGARIFIALPFFILAFYSYIGTKVAFLPLIIAVSIFAYFKNKKKWGRYYILFNLLSLLFVVFFAALLFTGPTNRAGEIFLPNDPSISIKVDEARKLSMAPGLLLTFFDNKITFYFIALAEKMFNVFSSGYLFISSDLFISLKHGLFYYIDAVFLMLGLVFSYAHKKNSFILLAGLVLVSILPQVFYRSSGFIFSPHLTLLFPVLLIIISFGISKTLEFSKSKIAQGAIIALYVISFLNFANIYFFSFPLQGHFDFPARELASYVNRASESTRVKAYVQVPNDSYGKYLYYTNSINKETINDIRKAYRDKKYVIGNVEFIPCGDIKHEVGKDEVVIYDSLHCKQYDAEASYLKIPLLADGGQVYRIYNDRICNDLSLKPYPSGVNIRDFNVERLSTKDFCETFITN